MPTSEGLAAVDMRLAAGAIRYAASMYNILIDTNRDDIDLVRCIGTVQLNGLTS